MGEKEFSTCPRAVWGTVIRSAGLPMICLLCKEERGKRDLVETLQLSLASHEDLSWDLLMTPEREAEVASVSIFPLTCVEQSTLFIALTKMKEGKGKMPPWPGESENWTQSLATWEIFDFKRSFKGWSLKTLHAKHQNRPTNKLRPLQGLETTRMLINVQALTFEEMNLVRFYDSMM